MITLKTINDTLEFEQEPKNSYEFKDGMRDDQNAKLSAQQEGKLKRMTGLLRKLGVITLLAAAVTFAVQTLHDANAFERYYMFLGFTLALAGTAVVCAKAFKDAKGARTLLEVALCFIPAHALQLGAVLYDLPHSNLPSAFFFGQLTAASVYATVAIAIALLIPVIYAANSALARGHAVLLTGLYAVSNGLLLLPVRDADLIAIVVAALMVAIAIWDHLFLRGVPELKTFEGRVVRGLLYAPPMLMIVRNVFYHGVTDFFVGVVYLLLGGSLIYAVQSNRAMARVKGEVAEIAGLASTFIGYYIAGPALMDSFGLRIQADWLFVSYGLPYLFFVAVYSIRSVCHGKTLRQLATCAAIAIAIGQLFFVGGVAASVICIMTAIVVIVGAFMMEEIGTFYAGAFGLAVGIVYQLRYAIDLYNNYPWVTLALLGIGVIIASSYLERNFQRIIARVGSFQARLNSWQ